MLDNPVEIILNIIVLFLVVWVALAMSLNIRDAHQRKRLLRRVRDKSGRYCRPRFIEGSSQKTVSVEQVMLLAEWKMEQWMTEREKLN